MSKTSGLLNMIMYNYNILPDFSATENIKNNQRCHQPFYEQV